ncbi:hypothetical protein TrST_g8863, partial [Triparma strigata]
EGNGNDNGEYTATAERKRFVEVKVEDSNNHAGYVVMSLSSYLAAQLTRIENEIEPACNSCPEWDVDGSNSEDWAGGYCAAYSMEDATGWSNWYSANCDEDCQAEGSEQEEEQEQEEEEEQEEEQEDEEEGDERRLRATRKRKLSTSGSSQPGVYNNVASFCMNCMNDCDEDGDVQKSLKIWQDFSEAECTETEVPSSTYNSDGELINYFIGPFCNGNTDEIKLGVFLDEYCTTVINVDAGYVIAQIEDYQDSAESEDEDATGTATANAVVTAIDVDLAWAIIETEIACDENKNDENDAPSYLATSGEQEEENEDEEDEVEFSEVCTTMLEVSFGCTGELLGYYNENTIAACSFVKLLKECDSDNWMSECTSTMIDLQGDTWAVDEGETMDMWAKQSSGNSGSGSNKLQKTVLSLTIPATAILGILACYYAGKISGDGKGSVELSRQGGAMA